MTIPRNNLAEAPPGPSAAGPQPAVQQPSYAWLPSAGLGARFLLLWMVAGVVGWAVAIPLAASAAQLVTDPLAASVIKDLVFGADVGRLVMLGGLAGGIVGAVIGLVTGALQWPALAARGIRGHTWALSTLIGWTTAMAATGAILLWFVPDLVEALGGLGNSFWHPSTLLPVLGYSCLGGAGIGSVVGLMQWLVLREQSTRAAIWLIASPVVWAIAAVVLVLVVGGSDWLPLLFSNGAFWVEIVAGVITGAVGAACAIPALRRVLV